MLSLNSSHWLTFFSHQVCAAICLLPCSLKAKAAWEMIHQQVAASCFRCPAFVENSSGLNACSSLRCCTMRSSSSKPNHPWQNTAIFTTKARNSKSRWRLVIFAQFSFFASQLFRAEESGNPSADYLIFCLYLWTTGQLCTWFAGAPTRSSIQRAQGCARYAIRGYPHSPALAHQHAALWAAS